MRAGPGLTAALHLAPSLGTAQPSSASASRLMPGVSQDPFLHLELTLLPAQSGLVQVLTHHAVRFIVILEKDAVFQRLVEERFCEATRSILVTAKGMPDLATRAFLKGLTAAFPRIPLTAGALAKHNITTTAPDLRYTPTGRFKVRLSLSSSKSSQAPWTVTCFGIG